jgi:hypothetical protein
MTIDDIHAAAVEIEREILDLAPAAPELAAVIARIRDLQGELERARATLGPLIPDAASPKSPAEQSADDLTKTLVDLLRAARAKQEEPTPSHP